MTRLKFYYLQIFFVKLHKSTFCRYAIHNSGIAFNLKKLGEGSAGNVCLHTQQNATIEQNICSLFGAAIAKELMSVQGENKSLKFKVIL